MKERIQDVVLSSASPPELQCANNMLDVKFPASLSLRVKTLLLIAVHGTVTCGP